MTMRVKSTLILKKQKNNDIKRICRDAKKIILTKWRLAAYKKSTIRQVQRQMQI